MSQNKIDSIFREYDIRGVVPNELNEKNVKKIGYLLGLELKKQMQKNSLKDTPCIAIGYDARVHSKELFSYLCYGLAQAEVKIVDLGLIPTPVAYFANFYDFGKEFPKIHGSIMITGSHNPPQYNGFKITLLKKSFFGEQITALGKDFKNLELKDRNKEPNITPIPVLKEYINFLVSKFKHIQDFKKLQIPLSIDCGNGVAAIALLPILDALDIPYSALYIEPDGTFPNHHPDPSIEANLSDLKKCLLERHGIGFAFDGDGDRLAVLCYNKDTNDIINLRGDEMGIIFAREIAKNIPKPKIIGEVKCSLNFYTEINKIGEAIMYKTGHSNLKTKLQKENAQAAFEVSGHIFFNDRYFGYDDAIYAALRTLEIITDGVCLTCEIKKLPKMYSTDENKIATTEEEKFVLIDKIKEILNHKAPSNFPQINEVTYIDGIRITFPNGWGLIRASNTTPVLVTRFEGKTLEDMKYYQDSMQNLITLAKQEI